MMVKSTILFQKPDTWATRSCDPRSCSDPKATPEDVQLMDQRLTQLIVPGGLLVHDDKNSSGNDEAMKILCLDR
ncbi:hypothetical protein DSO57_1018618 [Entomophthora muscae]|uniref:Uncharacterized protein n=1 Tax=Entomophthora muscae TaxID=34485 RepID=A0ACC2RVC1_9FUNG|nr:hypothetical protein DSO57_1018618 [Entomophthora muscae]